VRTIKSLSEQTSTVTMQLDEPGTAWCKAVRDRFDPPTINQIIAASFYAVTTLSNTDFTVQIQNLQRDTEYDVYCHARDRGTEVEYGVTPSAGNPGNDVTHSHVLTTKRDIHTMGDSTPPIITLVAPVHSESAVNIRPVFKITFNEDIQAGAASYVVFTPASGTPVSLPVSGVNNGLCTSDYARLTITLNVFQADFSQCITHVGLTAQNWYVSFAAGTFKDDSLTKNPVAAFGSSQSYFFTTSGAR